MVIDIEVKRKQGHYEIFVDKMFECSCDSNELIDSLYEIKNNLIEKYKNNCLQIELNMI